MGGKRDSTLTVDMVFEELPIVATETTVATKRLIRKETLARTAQKTAAKKKPAKKAAKKPKAKKAKKAKKPKAKKKKKKKKKKAKKKKKKKKKKKAKKVIYGKGGRKKGAHKSKKLVASNKKKALAQKAKGTGLFKKCTCSADLAAITGSKSMARPAAVKAVWAYIKKNKLNSGRTVKAVGKVFGGGSMFKLAGAIAKHMK